MPRPHRRVLAAGLTAMLLSLSCGTNRYELLERKDGTLARLDRWTGKIVIVEGSTMSPVPEPSSSPLDSLVGVSKTWPAQKIPVPADTALNVHVRSVWHAGKVFYNLTISPAKRLQGILRNSPRVDQEFTLIFEDEGGFNLLEVEVPISVMHRVVNDKGDAVSYEANGSVSATRDLYRAVHGVEINWRL